jgi:hypothetical protein
VDVPQKRKRGGFESRRNGLCGAGMASVGIFGVGVAARHDIGA